MPLALSPLPARPSLLARGAPGRPALAAAPSAASTSSGTSGTSGTSGISSSTSATGDGPAANSSEGDRGAADSGAAEVGGKGHALSDMTASSSASGGDAENEDDGKLTLRQAHEQEKEQVQAQDGQRQQVQAQVQAFLAKDPERERERRRRTATSARSIPQARRPRRPRLLSSSDSNCDSDDDDDVGCHTCSSNSIRAAMARMMDDAAGVAPPLQQQQQAQLPTSPRPPLSPTAMSDLGPASLRRQLSQSFIKEPSSAAALFKHLACLQWKSFVPGMHRHSNDEDDEDELGQRPGVPPRMRTESSYQSPANRRRRRTRRAYTSSFDGFTNEHYLDKPQSAAVNMASPHDESEDESDDEPFDEKYVVEQKHRAFWELVQRLLNQNDVVLMVRYVLEFLSDHLEASSCAVFLVDQNTQELSRITRGQTSLSGIAHARGIVGESYKSRVAFCKPDFRDENEYDAEVDLVQEFPGQKLFSVPLSENDVVYAVIQTTTSRASSHPEIDDLYIKLLTWLGPILSSCMRNCIEYHDVMLSERTQKALLHIISSSDTEDTVLNLVEGVIVGACHITKAERVSLFMVDWETEELWSLSTSYHDEKVRVPLNSSILGLAAKSQITLNVCDPANDARFNPSTDRRRGIRVQRALYVPVGIQQIESGKSSKPLAVLEIINKEVGSEFTFDDECAFEAFACEVAVILRRRSTEIAYMKLLADTLSEQVLAPETASQVNLLDVYTSYSYSTAARTDTLDRVAASSLVLGGNEDVRNATLATLAASSQSNTTMTVGCTCGRGDDISHPKPKAQQQRSGRLKFDFHSRPENSLFSAVPVDAKFFSWEFNVFNMDSDLLPQLIEGMYLDFKVDEILRTNKYVIQNFIVAMKGHYHPNPFHNFLHAFSVVHSAYLLLTTTDAAQMLQPLDIASCLVAALGHDVDHPGHTNGFEIVSGSQLALLYSDESVLEHHHAYTTFRLIAKEKNANILQNLSAADYRQVRKFIITAILGTDMANHFKFCETLEKTLRPLAHHLDTNAISSNKRDSGVFTFGAEGIKAKQSTELMSVLRDAVLPTDGASTPRSGGAAPSSTSLGGTSSGPGSISKLPSGRNCRESTCGWAYTGSLDDRLFLVKALVHTSDLSGQVFPTHVALKWSNMISKEFAYQALLEQAEGLPLTYNRVDDPLQMVESQLFFAQKIVTPLWDLMYLMFPELDVCVRNLATNVRHYEHELDRLKQLRAQGTEFDDVATMLSTSYRDSVSSCGDDGDGLAVPGLAKHNPAQFSSFRAIPEGEETDGDRRDRDAIEELVDEDLHSSGDDKLPVNRAVLSAALSSKSLRSHSHSVSSACSSSSSSSSSSVGEEVFDVELEQFSLE